MPLLGLVGDDTLRFVASVLSETPHAPPVLVRRLADQPVEISAPLLMRSPVLTSIDLVALIGRHGIAHARAIGARIDLDIRLARLIRSLGALDDAATAAPPEPVTDAAEETRTRLRAMMRPSGQPAGAAATAVRLRWEGDPGSYLKLRSTALTGVPALFQTALSKELEIGLEQARMIAVEAEGSVLTVALRALSLSPEEAFLIMRCAHPATPADPRAIATFLDTYEAIRLEDAEEAVARWRQTPWGNAANGAPLDSRLKAS